MIEGQEENDEDTQNTNVEVDLYKGIRLMAKSKQLAAIGGLLGSFMIHLIVGAIYRWNMITDYVGIYYGTTKITPIGAPLAMLCAGLTMRLGAKVSDSLGSRLVLSIGVTLTVVAVFISSQMDHFACKNDLIERFSCSTTCCTVWQPDSSSCLPSSSATSFSPS